MEEKGDEGKEDSKKDKKKKKEKKPKEPKEKKEKGPGCIQVFRLNVFICGKWCVLMNIFFFSDHDHRSERQGQGRQEHQRGDRREFNFFYFSPPT